MNATWIVAADRAGAHIYSTGPDGLALVQTMKHEEGRLKDVEMGTDEPGRTYDRSHMGRHALENPLPFHEQSALAFAQTLADTLRAARVEGRCSSLVLAAEPRFLGMLRRALDGQTEKLVSQTIHKDLQHLSERNLRQELVRLSS